MNFASDNTAGFSPEMLEALARANEGRAMPYGNDETTARVKERIAELFETEVEVFPVATGTAANALSISLLAPAWGAVWCHPESHANTDECAAPEFYTGGAKLIPAPASMAGYRPMASQRCWNMRAIAACMRRCPRR